MIVKEQQLASIRNDNFDRIIVFAHGVFDLLHVGHIKLLKWCKSQGDILIVGVSNDLRVSLRKGWGRPVMAESDRVTMIDALRIVDYTVLVNGPFDKVCPASLVVARNLQPNIAVLSDTCSTEEENLWQQQLDKTKVLRHPKYLRLTSTTEIIKRISD